MTYKSCRRIRDISPFRHPEVRHKFCRLFRIMSFEYVSEKSENINNTRMANAKR